MRRVDTHDKLWHDGDPVTGTPGTVVAAEMMNNFQEELCAIVEKFGGVLDPADKNQLYKMLANRMLQKTSNEPSIKGQLVQYADETGVNCEPSQVTCFNVLKSEQGDFTLKSYRYSLPTPIDLTLKQWNFVTAMVPGPFKSGDIMIKVEPYALTSGRLFSLYDIRDYQTPLELELAVYPNADYTMKILGIDFLYLRENETLEKK